MLSTYRHGIQIVEGHLIVVMAMLYIKGDLQISVID